jgi:hypothetical protein
LVYKLACCMKLTFENISSLMTGVHAVWCIRCTTILFSTPPSLPASPLQEKEVTVREEGLLNRTVPKIPPHTKHAPPPPLLGKRGGAGSLDTVTLAGGRGGVGGGGARGERGMKHAIRRAVSSLSHTRIQVHRSHPPFAYQAVVSEILSEPSIGVRDILMFSMLKSPPPPPPPPPPRHRVRCMRSR